MLPLVAAILGFVAVAGLGFVFAGPSETRASKRTQAVAGVTGGRKIARAAAVQTPDARRRQLLKTLKDQDRQQKKAATSLSARLQQAGLRMGLREFWIGSGMLAAVVLAILLLVGQPWWIAVGAAFSAGLGLPRWTVDLLANRRIGRFTGDFADAIDIVVRGIRSGLPVHDCLRVIAEETAEPLAGEFRQLGENLALGLSMEGALEKMYGRMPTTELRFFTIVLSIQQKTGGNLAEALSNLSNVLRARKMMREKIKALSAEAVASALIIGCMPPGVMAMISITSPAYMTPMFHDPRGQLMLLGGALWMTLGVLVMRRMINFKI
ncbi:type II secretion system F family protein [Caulobacter sp. NIBR2454]|uniref:type II secretion system F family protein n=1 Tax=Caulobacter sp. NIBR2454 TaxID=3015996 RepID=UPI0022B72BAF|nr:type II secretion system F family protein [Caulobacter sp. NIBR2454]